MHAITFALMWSAVVENVRQIAPKEWLATFSSLLAAVYYAMGPGLGSLVGGQVWELYGPRTMYRAFGVVVGALCLFRLVRIVVQGPRDKTEPPGSSPFPAVAAEELGGGEDGENSQELQEPLL